MTFAWEVPRKVWCCPFQKSRNPGPLRSVRLLCRQPCRSSVALAFTININEY